MGAARLKTVWHYKLPRILTRNDCSISSLEQ